MRVLIAEDEPDMLSLLSGYFQTHGHAVVTAVDGNQAKNAIASQPPDLALLDVRMPGCDGWEVLRWIRSEYPDLPTLMITALGSAEDAVRGLSLGADDYLRKPFDLSELDARIQAVMRRIDGQPPTEPVVEIGRVRIDDRGKTVHIEEIEIHLSPKEYSLLHLFASDPGRVFSNNEIIEQLWPNKAYADSSDVKQHIHLLRRKLSDAPGGSGLIENVKGFGYRLSVE